MRWNSSPTVPRRRSGWPWCGTRRATPSEPRPHCAASSKDHPDDQDAHYSLAIVCFSDGRIDAAKEQWETAAGIDPSSTTGRRSQSFVDLLDDQQSGAPEAN